MSSSVFHTIRELKLSVRVLVFSVLNVSELIRGLTLICECGLYAGVYDNIIFIIIIIIIIM